VAQLPEQFIEQAKSACFAAIFLDARQAAELDSRPPGRYWRWDAGAQQVVSALLDVKSQLVGHALLEVAT
jgi:hypothetical protein